MEEEAPSLGCLPLGVLMRIMQHLQDARHRCLAACTSRNLREAVKCSWQEDVVGHSARTTVDTDRFVSWLEALPTCKLRKFYFGGPVLYSSFLELCSSVRRHSRDMIALEMQASIPAFSMLPTSVGNPDILSAVPLLQECKMAGSHPRVSAHDGVVWFSHQALRRLAIQPDYHFCFGSFKHLEELVIFRDWEIQAAPHWAQRISPRKRARLEENMVVSISGLAQLRVLNICVSNFLVSMLAMRLKTLPLLEEANLEADMAAEESVVLYPEWEPGPRLAHFSIACNKLRLSSLEQLVLLTSVKFCCHEIISARKGHSGFRIHRDISNGLWYYALGKPPSGRPTSVAQAWETFWDT